LPSSGYRRLTAFCLLPVAFCLFSISQNHTARSINQFDVYRLDERFFIDYSLARVSIFPARLPGKPYPGGPSATANCFPTFAGK
jgi:hypothetical protein